MGNSVAKARALEAEEAEKVQSLINILENKRKEFVERVKLTRGQGDGSNKEIQGGRTASRISEIRVADSSGADPQIENAIGDFLSAAQGGDQAKNAAVKGATALLSAGLDALFGASSGAGLEKIGFVVLFINFAFVRVDYYVYSYNASGSKWGANANESGSCYVADLAILNPNEDVKAWEIDYLIGQALSVPQEKDADGNPLPTDTDIEYQAILKLKVQFVQSAILSRLIEKEDLTLRELKDITSELVETQAAIQDAFGSLSDFQNDPFIAVPDKPKAGGGDGGGSFVSNGSVSLTDPVEIGSDFEMNDIKLFSLLDIKDDATRWFDEADLAPKFIRTNFSQYTAASLDNIVFIPLRDATNPSSEPILKFVDGSIEGYYQLPNGRYFFNTSVNDNGEIVFTGQADRKIIIDPSKPPQFEYNDEFKTSTTADSN